MTLHSLTKAACLAALTALAATPAIAKPSFFRTLSADVALPPVSSGNAATIFSVTVPAGVWSATANIGARDLVDAGAGLICQIQAGSTTGGINFAATLSQVVVGTGAGASSWTQVPVTNTFVTTATATEVTVKCQQSSNSAPGVMVISPETNFVIIPLAGPLK